MARNIAREGARLHRGDNVALGVEIFHKRLEAITDEDMAFLEAGLQVALRRAVDELFGVKEALLEVDFLRFEIDIEEKDTTRCGAVVDRAVIIVVHMNRERCKRDIDGADVVLVAEIRSFT
jgi:hypothetical protein